MARWVAFAGLTVALVSVLLALARLSQRALSLDEETAPRDGRANSGRRSAVDHPDAPRSAVTDPVLPRFEPRAAAAKRQGHAERRRSGGRDLTAADLSAGALLANVVLTQGLFGLALAGGAWYFSIPLDALGLPATALGRGPTGLAVGVALGLGLWVANEATGVLADRLGVEYDETLRGMLAPDGAGGWAILLGVALPLVALVEEFVFRAALVGALSTGLGASAWGLAIVSAVAFGLAHGAQGRVGMAVTGGLGLALAGAFVVTESLLVVVVAHYLVNALELGVHEGLGVDRPTW